MSIDLARSVLQREQLKREASVQGQAVWECRLALVELKRKFPSLGTKEDEELFFDKERVAKKLKTEAPRYGLILLYSPEYSNTLQYRIPIKLRTRDATDLASPVAHPEPQIRPKEREAQIRSQIEQEVAKRKEENRSWDDLIDVCLSIILTCESMLSTCVESISATSSTISFTSIQSHSPFVQCLTRHASDWRSIREARQSPCSRRTSSFRSRRPLAHGQTLPSSRACRAHPAMGGRGGR